MEVRRGPGGAKGLLLVGAVVFLTGLFPLLDWFELLGRPSGWKLPPWLAFIFALIFPSIGLFLMMTALKEIWKAAERPLQWIGSLMLAITLICFLGGSAIFLTWQTIAPFGESSSSVSIGGIPIPLPAKVQAVIDRIFIGIAAFTLDVICLGAIWQGIRSSGLLKSED